MGHPSTWWALLCQGPAPRCHLRQDVPQVVLEDGGAELLHVAAQHLGSAAGALEPQELLPANWGGGMGGSAAASSASASPKSSHPPSLAHPQNENDPRQVGDQANRMTEQSSRCADGS